MIRERDERRLHERLRYIWDKLRLKMIEVYRTDKLRIEEYYAHIFVHKNLALLNEIAPSRPLAKFVHEKMYETARSVGPVPLDANEVWKIFRTYCFDQGLWYDQEIEKYLLSVRLELRREVLKHCGDDLLRREKYYAELMAVSNFEDLEMVKTDWSLAEWLHQRIIDVAQSGRYPLDVEHVWRVFRHTFFGRANMYEAEITARRLLWRLALTFESAQKSHTEEQATISDIYNLRDWENLSHSSLPHYLRNALANELTMGKRNENPSILRTEAWYRFRHLLLKYRSQIYSTTP